MAAGKPGRAPRFFKGAQMRPLQIKCTHQEYLTLMKAAMITSLKKERQVQMATFIREVALAESERIIKEDEGT